MKIRDLERARKEFDGKYAIDYPIPTQAEERDVKTGGALIWIWGIVAIAGAIISLPHTLRAVTSTVSDLPIWASIGYSIAVFIGVELALITVAYTQAYNELKNPTHKAPMTLRTITRAFAFRLGIVDTPAPKNAHTGSTSPSANATHKAGNIGGLLAVLFASALLFNMADATQNEALLALTKYTAGGLAPMLLLLAGHNFAHLLATKLLASQIAKRAHDEAIAQWYATRDEAWRRHIATITTPHTTPKIAPVVSAIPEGDEQAHHTTNGMTNGKGTDFLALTNGAGHGYQNGNGNAP